MLVLAKSGTLGKAQGWDPEGQLQPGLIQRGVREHVGLHLPKNPLGDMAREGRQHRDHPQRAHPLHDPVLMERRRE